MVTDLNLLLLSVPSVLIYHVYSFLTYIFLRLFLSFKKMILGTTFLHHDLRTVTQFPTNFQGDFESQEFTMRGPRTSRSSCVSRSVSSSPWWLRASMRMAFREPTRRSTAVMMGMEKTATWKFPMEIPHGDSMD